ncbi:MAG: hypothetical protein BMS9Abin37_0530 [Acidobacteriota bacterium]|nr:MAG: hypothetical protein BMS9Abin37_0530 [Acidobacteriota bacterium]
MRDTSHVDVANELESLRRLVATRKVCWDVFREKVGFTQGGVQAVGYELVLTGIHSPGEHTPRPGCELCREIYDDLKRAALWILPKEHRPSVYEIEPYHAIIRSTGKRRMRSEVSLSIKILHRDHYQAPIDTCETRCLMEMEEGLESIWACEGAWVPLERRGRHLSTP